MEDRINHSREVQRETTLVPRTGLRNQPYHHCSGQYRGAPCRRLVARGVILAPVQLQCPRCGTLQWLDPEPVQPHTREVISGQ